MSLKSAPRSLTLIFTSLLLSAALPLSAAIVNPCGSIAQATRTIGTDGSDGYRGTDGNDGQNGRDHTIEASDRPINLDLQGQNGSNGTSGGNAQHPFCDGHHGNPAENVEAADGGDGGDGGNGGRGGDGGTLTVYYQDIDQLKNIFVNAAGGEGGLGGNGGIPTAGCQCHVDSWTVTTCSDGDCKTESYSCRDGSHGSHGNTGYSGNDGETGQVRLIQLSEPLAEDTPVVEQAIANLSNTPLNLSLNLWEERTGAQLLFAGGSIIDDTYEAYAGRIEKQFQLEWAAERPQTLASGTLQIALNEQGDIQITPTEEIWIDGEISQTDNLTTYRVQGAVLASEAIRLAFGSNSGRGEAFTLNVIDLGRNSDLVETRFHLRYYTTEGERRPREVLRYESEVPTNLVTQDHNRFMLALGQLPINPRYLRPGTEARIELIATRTYAGNSADIALNWRDRL